MAEETKKKPGRPKKTAETAKTENKKTAKKTTAAKKAPAKTGVKPEQKAVMVKEEPAKTVVDTKKVMVEPIQKDHKKAENYGTVSLILGICSFFILGIITAIIGLVFALKSLKVDAHNSMARAGKILSIISLIFNAVVIVLFIVAVIAFSSYLITHPGAEYYFEQHWGDYI
jgi:hypothetical protein